ncbi:hypothetical protein [Streptomyces cadmiisoli]|uniref:hypothetical protein n=1 Tax=Streptomyces cadmiisoli TaxID=2184053 RepID=UPI0013A69E39|nr:hypothetical protein [Streptomyces cadmiisoli]
MNAPTHISTLALRHVIPPPDRMEQSPEVRPLIDGRDILAEIHPGGVANCPVWSWSGPADEWPLAALEEPREVELSNNDCVPACCGGVFVTIKRQRDRVVWSAWRNTNDVRVPVPATVHFDAAQYDTELARAAMDTTWEEPVDTVARLVTRKLADTGAFERWDCGVDKLEIQRAAPEGIEVHFSHCRTNQSSRGLSAAPRGRENGAGCPSGGRRCCLVRVSPIASRTRGPCAGIQCCCHEHARERL